MPRRSNNSTPIFTRRLTLATATTVLLTLPSLTSASILPRHLLDRHKLHAARQDDPSPASSDLPQVTLTVMPVPSDGGATPTIGVSSASTVSGLSRSGTAGLLDGLIFNGTEPVFPNVTVQEAVATVCPNATASVLPFPLFAVSAPASASAAGDATAAAQTASDSAAMGNASLVVGDSNARVDVGVDGCQTLFTPTVKAVCQTTVSLLGLPVVTVTECEQWVTFSSVTGCLMASMPTGVPVEATAGAGMRAVKRQDGDGASAPSAGGDGGVTSADRTALLPWPTAEPSLGPGTYYAVKWYDAARGGVPQRVRAVECQNVDDDDDVVGGGGACTTWEERWSETSVVRTVLERRSIAYSGAVVVTGGTSTYTTTINIATITTATRVTASLGVVKRRLLENGQEMGATSTVRMTSTLTETQYQGVATRTIQLVAGAAAGGVDAGA